VCDYTNYTPFLPFLPSHKEKNDQFAASGFHFFASYPLSIFALRIPRYYFQRIAANIPYNQFAVIVSIRDIAVHSVRQKNK